MNGRRAIVGLSLLCALAFCAVAAPGASAKGTTAFTCVKEGGSLDFSDAHCGTKVAKGTGEFGHEEIPANTETQFELTNEKVKNNTTEHEPSVLIGIISGIEVRVECTIVSGTGTLTNNTVGEAMRTSGDVTIKHSECTVPKPTTGGGEEKCQVKEVVYDAHFETAESGEEMWIEFTPKNGKEFGVLTLENHAPNKCSIAGSYGISGTFKGTMGGTPKGVGATLHFSAEGGSLKWGSWSYTLAGAITPRMASGGNPIAFTTL